MQTLDELIAVLEGLRAAHGGACPVVVQVGDEQAYYVRSVSHYGAGEVSVDDAGEVAVLPRCVQLDTTG